MIQANIHEAKTNLSRLLQQVEQGETVTLARNGKPIAKIVPLEERAPRQPGRLAGQFEVPDDFDAPLSAAELAEFGY